MAAIPGFIQVATDDFNRANQSPIAGNWTDSGGTTRLDIAGNQVVASNFVAADAEAIWNVWASGNDHYSQADITATGTSAGAGMGVYVRHTSTAGTQTGYRVVLDAGGNFELLKLTAGSGSSLRTGTVTYVGGQKLALSVTGGATTTLKIWYNGVQVGTDVTDSSSPFTTGVPGIAYSSSITSGSLDNWDAGIPDVGLAGLYRNALKPYPFQPSPR